MSLVTPPRTATPATIGNPTLPGLDGLRAMLDDWNERGVKSKEEGSVMPSTRKDPTPTQDQRKSVMASVYSEYNKMAKQEDKDLITRWTETLNILLTFAGLLSAVITAFLLASQPDLQPQPVASTNKILLHIAHQLDNTTDTSQLVGEAASTSFALKALSYWHASLGCSLMSAFGSLLSKQWVLHYQSNPTWANTVEEQCRLREIRAYGLSKWRMYAIVESLPVLLQLSVFLFYLGLVESVRFAPTLVRITTAFASIIAAFYALTLLAGAVSASCPFKSPIADFVLKMMLSFFNFIIFLIVVFMMLLNILLRQCLKIPPFVDGDILVNGRGQFARIWHKHPYKFEQNLARSPRSQAGIAFWWLQEFKLRSLPTTVMVRTVAHIAMDIPIYQARGMAIWRGGFGKWCYGVFGALDHRNPPSNTSIGEVDLICHLMHGSAKGMRLVRNGLAEHISTDPDKLSPYISTRIRNSWSQSSGQATVPQLLRLEDMPYRTLATYLQFQLVDWRYNHVEPGIMSNRDLLLQELPIILKQGSSVILTRLPRGIVDAAALAALALVPQDASQHIQPIERLIDPPLLERLLQALHRLSYYPVDQPPNQLVPQVVATACGVMKFRNTIQSLYKCKIWCNGEFAMCIYRLIRLSRVWWHAENGDDQLGPGACLVREIQSLMDLVINHGIAKSPAVLSNVLPISSDSLAEVFGVYAHPQAPLQSTAEHPIHPTRLLNFTLTLRYVTYSPPSWTVNPGRLLRRNQPPKYVWSTAPTFTLQLGGRTQVLRQLIQDLGPAPTNPIPGYTELRRASLTAMVMGRDIFLPPLSSTRYPDLTAEVGRLASEMAQTGEFIYELTEEMFSSFDKWEELLQALGDLLQLLEQGEREGVWHLAARPLVAMFQTPE